MTKTMDIKSLLIGFLLATSVMLFMGATSDNQIGRYQGFSSDKGVYMIDTKNGELYTIFINSFEAYNFPKLWVKQSNGFHKTSKK